MKTMPAATVSRAMAAALVLWLAMTSREAAAQQAETMAAPTFGSVTIYRSPGTPKQVVLFVSGDGGWNLGVVAMAEQLRDAGALVVGIDIRRFMSSLEAADGCAYPAGALEELSRAVQLRLKLPVYRRPILVGYSSGATLVYAAIAAAPPETFAGAISLGFCHDIEIHAPPCHMRGLTATKRLKGVGYDLAPFAGSVVPWMVLQGEVDQVCDAGATRAFVAATGSARLFSLPKVGHGFGVPARWQPQFLEAYRAIAASRPSGETPRATAPAVADLSLVEVPATSASRNTMVVLLTGDGGWADMDKTIAARLAAAGVPVVGWSSLEDLLDAAHAGRRRGRPRANREPLRGGLAAGTRDRRWVLVRGRRRSVPRESPHRCGEEPGGRRGASRPVRYRSV